MFRAIFRYATYANLADSLISVTIEETEKVSGKTLHHQLTHALFNRLRANPRKVFGMSMWSFWAVADNKKVCYGVIICTLLSISVTCLLLLLIW